VTTADLQALWQSGQLLVDEATAVVISQLWGQPATIAVVDDVVAALWANRAAYGLLPFEQLTPDLKVLAVDGLSPLKADFAADTYPLTVKIGAVGEETAVAQFLAYWQPLSNRTADKLTRVAMTGVTALTRATALQMEVYGVQHPGTAVAPVLQTADIAHVSHEVSFSPDCPYPDPVGGTSFCARDSYFDLLTEIGIDVVELTGNHLNDYGRDNMTHSLALYDEADMMTFGGGENLADAAVPALFEHNGNRLAFVGCNPVGPNYAWATADLPGAGQCDAAFYAQMTALAQQGYIVIATLQYSEYYHYAAPADQRAAFAAMVEAGATAVSGSQGHHAQGFAFHHSSFIHYGLGNLFFDQMDMLGTRQTFIDTYVVYNGRLLSVELWTGLIESWCCPRVMTAAEREQVLTAVFQASDW
jgi:poly-gamma-glutamate synthesis protein (capsule biosynthesis protein)